MENYRDFKIGNPVFVGISSMSGLQIGYGLEFAREVRKQNPSCPIVWGGVHPTLLPEQTAANENVDIVVRGEGESTIVQLADKLVAAQPLDGVMGITYKSEGKVKSNPDASPIDLDKIPLNLPFNLLPMDRYPSFRAGRFHIQTSRGCPHACGFCYNLVFNKRKWRGKSVRRVVDEVEYILGKFPHVKCIDTIDDNFFVDKKRVENICRGMIERGIDITWRASCRFDYMSRYDADFIRLLEKSGCVELDFGAETGSGRLLSLMNKDITPDQMIKSVDNLRKCGPSIEPYVSWMGGLPTETENDLRETFDLMDKMTETNNKVQHFGFFTYTPFPSPFLKSLKFGFKLPRSLDEWAEMDMFHFKPPWHSKRYVEKLHAISAVTRYAFYPQSRMKEHSASYRLAYNVLHRMAKTRWKRRCFGIPVELRVVNWFARRSRGYI
jgi:radical SAM superfamily enzyme YgiQ (UPF0313 family)